MDHYHNQLLKQQQQRKLRLSFSFRSMSSEDMADMSPLEKKLYREFAHEEAKSRVSQGRVSRVSSHGSDGSSSSFNSKIFSTSPRRLSTSSHHSTSFEDLRRCVKEQRRRRFSSKDVSSDIPKNLFRSSKTEQDLEDDNGSTGRKTPSSYLLKAGRRATSLDSNRFDAIFRLRKSSPQFNASQQSAKHSSHDPIPQSRRKTFATTAQQHSRDLIRGFSRSSFGAGNRSSTMWVIEEMLASTLPKEPTRPHGLERKSKSQQDLGIKPVHDPVLEEISKRNSAQLASIHPAFTHQVHESLKSGEVRHVRRNRRFRVPKTPYSTLRGTVDSAEMSGDSENDLLKDTCSSDSRPSSSYTHTSSSSDIDPSSLDEDAAVSSANASPQTTQRDKKRSVRRRLFGGLSSSTSPPPSPVVSHRSLSNQPNMGAKVSSFVSASVSRLKHVRKGSGTALTPSSSPISPKRQFLSHDGDFPSGPGSLNSSTGSVRIQTMEPEEVEEERLPGVVFSVLSNGSKIMKYATKEHLLQQILEDTVVVERDFTEVIVLTHPLFLSTHSLIQFLLTKFRDLEEEAEAPAGSTPTSTSLSSSSSSNREQLRNILQRSRVIRMLVRIVEQCLPFPAHAACLPPMRKFAQVLVSTARSPEKEWGYQIENSLKNCYLPASPSVIAVLPAMSNNGAQLDNIVSFLHVNTDDLAAHLTAVDWEMYKSVCPLDMYNAALNIQRRSFHASKRSSRNSELSTDSVNKTTRPTSTKESDLTLLGKRFNLICNWFATEILTAPNDKDRVQMICKLIDLALKLKQMKNFHGLISVYSALQMHAVSRLKFVWAMVDKKHRALFEKLSEELSTARKWQNYRYMISKAEAPFIPFEGIMFSDLLGIWENQDGEDGKISLSKLRLFNTQMKMLKRSQQKEYSCRANYFIEEHILSASVLDDDQRWIMSQSILERERLIREKSPKFAGKTGSFLKLK